MKELPFESDKKILISSGGCSIVGDGWDLTLPSKEYDRTVKEFGMNEDALKHAMIKYYKKFYKLN